jgi:outer membrane protein TolC
MTTAPRLAAALALLALFAAPVPAAPPGPEPEPAAVRLTLAEALERAAASAPRLATLAAREQAAVALVDEARAQRGPESFLTGFAARLSSVPELTIAFPGAPPQTVFPSIENNFGARIGLTQPIYTGGRIPAQVDAAASERQATAQDRLAAGHDLALETATAYWGLVTAREAEAVLSESIAVFEAQLVDTANMLRYGMVAESDLLNVRVQRDRAVLDRLQARAAADTAEANLARLVGLPPGSRIEAAEPLRAEPPGAPAPEPQPLDALLADARAARPERAALLARIEALRAAVRVEESAWRPQVFAQGGYDYARPNREVLPFTDEWNGTWDVALGVSFRVFDNGRTRAAVARRHAQLAAEEQRLRELDDAIALEVVARRIELETARAAVPVAESAVEAARESRRSSGEQYRAGVISSTDLLAVQNAALRAGLERTAALAQVRLAGARLDRATGR